MDDKKGMLWGRRIEDPIEIEKIKRKQMEDAIIDKPVEEKNDILKKQQEDQKKQREMAEAAAIELEARNTAKKQIELNAHNDTNNDINNAMNDTINEAVVEEDQETESNESNSNNAANNNSNDTSNNVPEKTKSAREMAKKINPYLEELKSIELGDKQWDNMLALNSIYTEEHKASLGLRTLTAAMVAENPSMRSFTNASAYMGLSAMQTRRGKKLLKNMQKLQEQRGNLALRIAKANTELETIIAERYERKVEEAKQMDMDERSDAEGYVNVNGSNGSGKIGKVVKPMLFMGVIGAIGSKFSDIRDAIEQRLKKNKENKDLGKQPDTEEVIETFVTTTDSAEVDNSGTHNVKPLLETTSATAQKAIETTDSKPVTNIINEDQKNEDIEARVVEEIAQQDLENAIKGYYYENTETTTMERITEILDESVLSGIDGFESNIDKLHEIISENNGVAAEYLNCDEISVALKGSEVYSMYKEGKLSAKEVLEVAYIQSYLEELEDNNYTLSDCKKVLSPGLVKIVEIIEKEEISDIQNAYSLMIDELNKRPEQELEVQSNDVENTETEESVDEESVDEESVDEESVDEESVDEESVDEESVDEESVDEESVENKESVENIGDLNVNNPENIDNVNAAIVDGLDSKPQNPTTVLAKTHITIPKGNSRDKDKVPEALRKACDEMDNNQKNQAEKANELNK